MSKPVDSERKIYGKPLGSTARGWLATQSMAAYSRWMDWLYEPEPENREALMYMLKPENRQLIRRAYERDKADKQRS